MTKTEISRICFEFKTLGFWYCLGFRASCFEFPCAKHKALTLC